MKRRSCECLDFVEAVHSHRSYPLMYCHMELEHSLDRSRLQTAVSRSCRYVPEILYAFDFKNACFVKNGFTPKHIIQSGCYLSPWDLGKNPQLRIVVGEKKLIIVMSHLLCDGQGFVQYLYLLASLYNGHIPIFPLENNRDISHVLKKIQIGPPTEQARHQRHITLPALRKNSKGKQHFCLCSRILPEDFSALYSKSRKHNVTLNDVFITAYARVISQLSGIQTVIIPCPADLRTFSSKPDQLSVANMMGIYRRIVVEMDPRHSFRETLSQVHIEMELQKSRHRCFASLRPLDHAFHKMPPSVLTQCIKWFYRISPVSYTNFGKIDHMKLSFMDCQVKSCYLTGTYRLPPDFQLSISTFHNVCTLNCTLIGEDKDRMAGQNILDEVKMEMMGWVNMD